MAPTLGLARRCSRDAWRTHSKVQRALAARGGDVWPPSLHEANTNYASLEAKTNDTLASTNALLNDWSLDDSDPPDITDHTTTTPTKRDPHSPAASSLLPRPTKTTIPSHSLLPKRPSPSPTHHDTAVLLKDLEILKQANASLKQDNIRLSQSHADQREKLASLSDSVKLLRREKETLEKSKKADVLIPSRREREQLDLLRLKITDLQHTVKQTELKSSAAIDRYKTRVDELTRANSELREEVRVLEQERQMQQQQVVMMMAAAAAEGASAVKRGVGVGAVGGGGKSGKVQHQPSVSSLPPLVAGKPQQQQAVSGLQGSGAGGLEKRKSSGTLQQQRQQQSPSSSSAKTATPPPPPSVTIPPSRTAVAKPAPPPPRTNGVAQPAQPLQHQRSRQNLEVGLFDEGRKALDELQGKLGICESFTETQVQNAKLVRQYESGQLVSWYKNGTMKLKHSSGDAGAGSMTKIFFNNGDFKETNGGRVVYWYAEKQILHTTFEDGLETVNFMESGQIEKHYPDGTQEIVFKDSTVKYIYANGEEKSIFPDGTIQKIDANGCRTVQFT
ncbi:hypothetical protein HDU98_008294 [Podochytrium sp. JEL0797]|nr:hypothetical protein HDU98_008294 [Podochytrium sp. JEL0797]